MPTGRPPEFSDPKELENRISDYFEHIKGEFEEKEIPDPDDPTGFVLEKVWSRYPEPPTITGMCLFLGFESRQSFHDYQKKKEFSYAIKKARLQIECEYEKALQTSKNPTGSIFALKNMGWSDKQEIEHTGGTDLRITRKVV